MSTGQTGNPGIDELCTLQKNAKTSVVFFGDGGLLFPSDKCPDIKEQWILVIKREDQEKVSGSHHQPVLSVSSYFNSPDYIQGVVYGK